jgi:hypothetical protein
MKLTVAFGAHSLSASVSSQSHMNCLIYVSRRDQGTAAIAERMEGPLDELSGLLSKDYGGSLANLWIEVELSPVVPDLRPPWSFRFQKAVSPPKTLRAFGMGTALNVGHYNIRPDYFELAKVPSEDVVCYLLCKLYESTQVLEQKSKRLGGFKVEAFRADFLAAVRALGCEPLRNAS